MMKLAAVVKPFMPKSYINMFLIFANGSCDVLKTAMKHQAGGHFGFSTLRYP